MKRINRFRAHGGVTLKEFVMNKVQEILNGAMTLKEKELALMKEAGYAFEAGNYSGAYEIYAHARVIRNLMKMTVSMH